MERLTGRFGETDFSGSIGLDLQAKPTSIFESPRNFSTSRRLPTPLGFGRDCDRFQVDTEGRTAAGIADRVNAHAAIQSTKMSFSARPTTTFTCRARCRTAN